MSKLARLDTIVAAVGTPGVGAAGPALAGTSNVGQDGYMCASMMLRYDLTDELGGS